MGGVSRPGLGLKQSTSPQPASPPSQVPARWRCIVCTSRARRRETPSRLVTRASQGGCSVGRSIRRRPRPTETNRRQRRHGRRCHTDRHTKLPYDTARGLRVSPAQRATRAIFRPKPSGDVVHSIKPANNIHFRHQHSSITLNHFATNRHDGHGSGALSVCGAVFARESGHSRPDGAAESRVARGSAREPTGAR